MPAGLSIGTVDDASWDAFVAGHPDGSAYHYAGWPRLIARAAGHEAVLLAAQDGTRIVGVLPLVVMRSVLFGRFVVSLPFLNEGGLLTADERAVEPLVAESIGLGRQAGARYVELRHTRRRQASLVERSHKVAMTLALAPDAEAQWHALDRKVRNQVRKGEKSGLSVAAGGAEVLAGFYEVFSRNMRDLGTPVFGVALFEEVLRTYAQNSRVFVVRHGTKPVAGAIVHWRGSTLEVIWASALREASPLSANVLLYWHLVQFAIEQGCTRFEFGRCTPNEGTFHFKKQWGAEPRPLVWEYWYGRPTADVDQSPRNPKYRAAVRVWQCLPVSLTTLVGPRIVHNIPC